jgi:hypothetical protein
MAGGGFGYTALVIDACAGLIPDWECSTSKEAPSCDGRSAKPLATGATRAIR